MYLYFLPPNPESTPSSSSSPSSQETAITIPTDTSPIIVPTPDGGIEHTSATFATPSTWLSLHHARKISMFPPQYFLLTLLSRFFPRAAEAGTPSRSVVDRERRDLLEFIGRVPATFGGERELGHPTSAIPWAEKIISPRVLKARGDGYLVLGLDRTGAEVEAIGDGKVRGGVADAVVVVNLKAKGGPWNLGVFGKDEAMKEENLVKGGKL